MIIFSRKTSMLAGYQYFRKPPTFIYVFIVHAISFIGIPTIPKQFAAALQLPPPESHPPHEGLNLGVFNGFAVDGSEIPRPNTWDRAFNPK